MERSLRNRLIFGTLMLMGLFIVLWLDHAIQVWTRSKQIPYGVGGTGILLLLAIMLPAATMEIAYLFTAENVRPYRTITFAGSGALMAHAFCTQFQFFKTISASTLMFIVVSVMIAAALRRAASKRTDDAIIRMAGTVLSTLYLGGLGWFLMALRVKRSFWHTGEPRFIGTTVVVLFILLCVKFTDIGAYFGGKKFGKHKLIPWLSPGKTKEGLAFGLLTAGIVGAICAHFIYYRMDPTGGESASGLVWWKGAIFGMLIGAVGQAGDLLESLMKRDAGVKDSGRSIPGFGGVLDVIDSPMLAAPFAYLLFSLL